jgi:putrescine aminotransferase
MHPQWDFPIPGFAKVPAPYWYGAKAAGYGDIGPEEVGRLIAQKLEEKIRQIGPERVASFSAEPVQGAGGLIIPPSTYWPEVQRICREYDVLLHADEVITAFGRLGEWTGSHYYGIDPDIITMAKGISSGYQPLSAISLGARIGDAIANANEELVHGYTYSGHHVASAVALKNLEIMEHEKIPQRVKTRTGPYLLKRLVEALSDHPLVGEVRGAGLLAGIELVADKKERRFFPRDQDVGTRCRNHCFHNGLIMRAVRDTMVLAPPLVISEGEIDEIVAKAKYCIDRTAKELGKM